MNEWKLKWWFYSKLGEKYIKNESQRTKNVLKNQKSQEIQNKNCLLRFVLAYIFF